MLKTYSMPISKEEGLKILISTVKFGRYHRDYKRVVDLAAKYYKLITGEGIETLMRQFSRREDDALFKQRIAYTQHITPSVANTIMSYFYKVGRVNVVKREISFKETDKNDQTNKSAEIEKAIAIYYGDKSLDKYLETRFVELQFCDPNSFIVTEFEEKRDDRGILIEKVKPYPWEVSAEDAVNFKYKNNILQWLIVKEDDSIEQKYTTGDGERKTIEKKEEAACNYTLYLDDIAIKFTQVPFESVIGVPEDGTIVDAAYIDASGKTVKVQYIRFDKQKLFRIDYYEHKAGRVPAVRIGYKRDLSTDGRTFVSPMEPAVPYFMKTIKSVSEMDLTEGLHVFPQKIQYVPRCTGASKELGCDGGKNSAGNTCSVCQGTGQMPTHASAQDALFLRMPKDNKDMMDLDKLMIYKSPPIDLVKWMDEYIDKLERKCLRSIFPSQKVEQTNGTTTATELDYAYEDQYNTLFPFAEKYADVWKYSAIVIAGLIDFKEIIVDYRFPKDFKFKSVDDLLNELKLANDSSAPSYVKQQISQDIAAQQFVDKPEELKKIQVKEKFFPFSGKSSTEIVFIISNEKTTKAQEILWANFEQIFEELEQDNIKANKSFYGLSYEEQKKAIDEKVKMIIGSIETPVAAGTFAGQTEDPNNPGFDINGEKMAAA